MLVIILFKKVFYRKGRETHVNYSSNPAFANVSAIVTHKRKYRKTYR